MKKNTAILLIMILLIIPFLISAQPPIKVVCVGNSITEGYGNTTQAKAWPGQLNILLGSRYTILNCGASGTRMSKTVGPSYWNDARFTNAMNANPQILIISLGTNDGDQNLWASIKPTFKKDYLAMIDTFRTRGRNPVIYTCLPPPVFANSIQTAHIKNEIIPIIKEISALKGTYIIDYNTPLLTYSNVFPDGIHPNDEGALVMANIAYGIVRNTQLITPYISVDGADSVETTTVTVSTGGEISFKPKAPDAGTWSWTGPNGFTSTSRVVTFSNVQFNRGGAYTVVYTNPEGQRCVQNFMITIKGCTAAAIIPYINSGSWMQATSATVHPGGSVSFGPQPTDGIWCWAGPDGFFSNSREFTLGNILKSQAGVYTATYYNTSGCKSIQDFTVNVEGDVVCPAIIPYLSVNGVWQAAGVIAASLKSGGSIKFGPQPSDGTWSWKGPDGFISDSREASVNNIQTRQAGKYTGTFTTVAGCIKTITFTITVDGVSAVDLTEDNNSAIKSFPNPATDRVTLTNIPFNSTISLFDLYGQLIMHMKSTVENENIDITNLKAGSYFIRIGERACHTIKLLKI